MITELSFPIGVKAACKGFGVSRSSYYYWKKGTPKMSISRPKRTPDFTYSEQERKDILTVMNSEIYMDDTPYEIFASQLDKGNYLCSIRTMYRILEENDQVKERRNIKRTNNYQKPELLATEPNQVWSWDITKLKGPEKWTYFYLYVIMDIFSRFVVGWMVAHRELSSLAKKLIKETCERQHIEPGQLTIHADRGSSMKSKPVAFLLSDLGVTKSHSRPYVSNDNPYSESQFKTLKYRPDFPCNFHYIEAARKFCRGFFNWYNTQHYHSGIGFLTPESVHYGFANEILIKRNNVLLKAFQENPKRFRNKKPSPKNIPKSVWINKPDNIELAEK
jgi:putative transposase